jgi:uncharacterized protein (TIGR02118 family)
MITRLGCAPRRPGMTTPAFIDHWRTGHADAASAIPGLRSYVQLHPVLLGGVHALGYPGFDACSELDFDSLEAMDAGFASEAYQGAVRDDEEMFIDKQRFSLVLAEREVLSGTRGDGGGVRLVTFLRRHPAVAAGQLLGAVTGPYAERAAAAVIGHEVLRAIDHDRPDRQQQAADVVDELVFSGVESALDWCASEGATEAGLALAGLTAGTVRLLVRGHVVV